MSKLNPLANCPGVSDVMERDWAPSRETNPSSTADAFTHAVRPMASMRMHIFLLALFIENIVSPESFLPRC
jgi:hypothetical protein